MWSPVGISLPKLNFKFLSGVGVGIILGIGGIILGFIVSFWINRKKTGLHEDTESFLAGARDRDFLSKSLAIDDKKAALLTAI